MKTGYSPVDGNDYTSGPGCHVASGWGWTTLVVLVVGALLYVGGGIGFGMKAQGAAPGISAHPHLSQWKELNGLVVDGFIFAHAHVVTKIKGQTASETEQDSAGDADGEKEQHAGTNGTDGEMDAETTGLLATQEAKKNYGAAGARVDPSAFAAAAAEGGGANDPGTATSGSDDDLVE